MSKMKAKEKYMTQGIGLAIHYAYCIDYNFAECLFNELNIPLEDYEAVCDPIDLPYIRKAAAGK